MKYKILYKNIEKVVRALEFSPDEKKLIHNVLNTVLSQYGKVLKITGGRLYIKDNNHYRLIKQIGKQPAKQPQKELSSEYLPIRKLRQNKYIIMHQHNGESDSNVRPYLVADTFAAIALGNQDKYLASFSIVEPCDEEQLHFSLNTIRFVTNLKLRELTLQNEFLKAREIQLSLLPSYTVERKGFDIYGKSIPADLVGGDAYDYLHISDDTLGIAMMDAVGHGLPAALQARDAVTGLRMGSAGNLKIEFLISRLNQVIHRSNLTSRFVSLFYGELEEYGNFVYTNAGHPPPLFVRGDDIYQLTRGGMVLGPNPKATYKRGFIYFHPDDVLLIYSDGISEARKKSGELFGVERLKTILKSNTHLTSKDLIELIFQDVTEFSQTNTPSDDQTLIVIKRTAQDISI